MKINISNCTARVLVTDDAGNPLGNGLCTIEMYIHGGPGHISHPETATDLISRNEGRENDG